MIKKNIKKTSAQFLASLYVQKNEAQATKVSL